MQIFYVDTENVNQKSWVNALGKLTAKDEVILFYTEHSAGLSLCNLNKIRNSCATLTLVKTPCGRPNALDFALVAYVGRRTYTAKKSSHYIVSNDKGYLSTAQFLSNMFNVKIELVSSISDIWNEKR